MPKRNQVIHMDQVFTRFFLDYMERVLDPDNMTTKDLNLVMQQIEAYEDKEELRFVCFMGNEFLIFRTND